MTALPSQINPINRIFLNELIDHHLLTLSLSDVLKNEANRLLDETEKKILQRLVSVPSPNPTGRAFLARSLFNFVRSLRKEAWRKIAIIWKEKLIEAISQEPRKTADVLDKILPVVVTFSFPLKVTLISIMTNEPYLGKTFNQWMRNIEAADIERINDAIKIGVFRGENGRQIARRVLGQKRLNGRNGITQLARNNVGSLAQTSTNSLINLGRREFYKSNLRLFNDELYVATLDKRTTEICNSLNGKFFPIGEGPYPPVHFNCRSLRVGELSSDVLGRSPLKPDMELKLLREFATKRGLRDIKDRSDLPFGTRGLFDKFVKQRLKSLTGKL